MKKQHLIIVTGLVLMLPLSMDCVADDTNTINTIVCVAPNGHVSTVTPKNSSNSSDSNDSDDSSTYEKNSTITGTAFNCADASSTTDGVTLNSISSLNPTPEQLNPDNTISFTVPAKQDGLPSDNEFSIHLQCQDTFATAETSSNSSYCTNPVQNANGSTTCDKTVLFIPESFNVNNSSKTGEFGAVKVCGTYVANMETHILSNKQGAYASIDIGNTCPSDMTVDISAINCNSEWKGIFGGVNVRDEILPFPNVNIGGWLHNSDPVWKGDLYTSGQILAYYYKTETN